MALDQKLEQAKKLLEQIQKVYDELGKTNPFQGMDPNTVALSNKEIDKLEIALTGITKKANDLEKGFGGIAKSIGASLAEMTKQSSATNRTVKAMRSLSSISESLKNDQSGLSKLSLKELESKRDKAKILSQEAKSQAALVKQKYDEITLDKNGNQLQGDELNAKLKSLGISKSELQTMNEIVAAHEAQFPVLDELNAKIKERIEEEKKVNKTLGLTKFALEGLGKIPIVGPLLETNEALDAARTKAKAGGNALQSFGAAMGSMLGSLASGLTSPLFFSRTFSKRF
jgi:chromosome segregation ATPase